MGILGVRSTPLHSLCCLLSVGLGIGLGVSGDGDAHVDLLGWLSSGVAGGVVTLPRGVGLGVGDGKVNLLGWVSAEVSGGVVTLPRGDGLGVRGVGVIGLSPGAASEVVPVARGVSGALVLTAHSNASGGGLLFDGEG